jgi:hypothetical protein
VANINDLKTRTAPVIEPVDADKMKKCVTLWTSTIILLSFYLKHRLRDWTASVLRQKAYSVDVG